MTLYWGGRRPQDLYMDALCREWAAQLPNFKYVPVLSNLLPEDHWAGRTGFVHHAVMADLPDLSGHQVYACGAPIVVESAKRDFVARCRFRMRRSPPADNPGRRHASGVRGTCAEKKPAIHRQIRGRGFRHGGAATQRNRSSVLGL